MSARLRFLIFCTVWAATVCVVSATTALARFDVGFEWRTISTEHFNVHFPKRIEKIGARVAEIGEEVHPTMAKAVGWTPVEPVEVVVVDDTDLANGFTTTIPYNRMVLYAVEPPAIISIADVDDWLRTLFIHEYAHVLALDATRGYPKVLRAIFGKPLLLNPLTFFILPPNVYLPPWFHEGLAVNFESEMTGRGRKFSTYYDMIYRTDVAEDAIPPLDRLGGDFPGWPTFSTRYIYGSRLMGLVVEKEGLEGLGELVRHHAGRFPFTIDRPPRVLVGEDYQGLYKKMVDELVALYSPRISELKTSGVTTTKELTSGGFVTSGPVWDGKGGLIFTRASTTGPSMLVRLDLSTGEEQGLTERVGGYARVSVDLDGVVWYTAVDVDRPLAGGNLFTDIFSFDPATSIVRQHTEGGRFRYADLHAESDRFIVVNVDGNGQSLVELTQSKKNGFKQRVILAEQGVRYDNPRWSPTGDRVVVSRKTGSGTERLTLVDARSGEFRVVTGEGTRALFGDWSSDGEKVVFSWDRSGVFDLYELDVKSGGIKRLTRLLTGGFEAVLDGDLVYFMRYSADGFDLARLERRDSLGELVKTSAVTTKHSEGGPSGNDSEAKNGEVGSAEYSPLYSMRPRFWLPDAIVDHEGAGPGAWTVGFDPLDRHVWHAAGYWVSSSRRGYGRFTYQYDGLYPTLGIWATKLPLVHSDLIRENGNKHDYWEEIRTLGFSASASLPGTLSDFSAGIGWTFEQVKRLTENSDLGGAVTSGLFEGRQNPLTLFLLYDNAFPYNTPFTIGPESGRQVSLTYNLRHEFVGSELNRQELLGRWSEYFGLPFERSVLMVRGTVARSWGDKAEQSVFQIGGVDTPLAVRGYPDRVDRGESAAVGTVEARFPAWSPFRGILDWPLFLKRLHGAAFFDAGRTWDGDDEELRTSLGMELRLDTVLGYYAHLPTVLAVGYAHGFNEDGGGRAYVKFLAEL